jgi:precorrin isomerase
MHIQGIIKGKYIELAHKTGIPDGMTIVVDIRMLIPSFQEQFKMIDNLCGAWVKDPSIPEIFAEINEQRHQSRSRELTFNISS